MCLEEYRLSNRTHAVSPASLSKSRHVDAKTCDDWRTSFSAVNGRYRAKWARTDHLGSSNAGQSCGICRAFASVETMRIVTRTPREPWGRACVSLDESSPGLTVADVILSLWSEDGKEGVIFRMSLRPKESYCFGHGKDEC